MREIKLLQLLDHENIIKVVDIVAAPDGVSLVFDYFEHDLSGIIQHPTADLLALPQIKYILHKLLLALEYLHARKIVHRDLKTSNILIGGAKGEVKLADFGLAKSILSPDVPGEAGKPTRPMTNRVVTLWYRPPEILLGSTQYGVAADMWGVGCILVELFTRKPLFAGTTEVGQIVSVLRRYRDRRALEEYPWTALVGLDQIECEEPMREYLAPKLPSDALDLTLSLLALDPAKRLSANQALAHPFFKNSPAAAPMVPAAVEGDWHEWECKQRKKEPSRPPTSSSAR